MGEICDCCCENKKCNEVCFRIVCIIFYIIGNIFVAVEYKGNEGSIKFLVVVFVFEISFFVLYYFLFIILKCCDCNHKCEKCLYVTLFILNTIFLLLEFVIIVLIIVGLAKTKKYEKIDENDKKPYKIEESDYNAFLGLSISGIILMLIGSIFILYDNKKMKKIISYL